MEAPGKSEETVSNYTPRISRTANWCIETGSGVLAGAIVGMLFGGMEAALEKRCQLKKDAMEKRFERITRGSINGGVRLGLFGGAFYGLQNLLAEKRVVHDVFNYVCAGSATNAAASGLTVRGSPLFHATNVVGASVSGAALGFAIGWFEIKVLKKTNGGNVDSYQRREAGTGVGAAKERLEENLNE
ncbi:Mitochondrial import inner membrane translocase subunit Tim17/Tim22/Tim23 family protein [Fagus crenata]